MYSLPLFRDPLQRAVLRIKLHPRISFHTSSGNHMQVSPLGKG